MPRAECFTESPVITSFKNLNVSKSFLSDAFECTVLEQTVKQSSQIVFETESPETVLEHGECLPQSSEGGLPSPSTAGGQVWYLPVHAILHE